MKNLEKINFIFSLDVHKNLPVNDIENYQIYEGYIETRAGICKRQSTKTSFSLTPDHDSCEEAIKRLHYQAYCWNKCLQSTIDSLNIEENGGQIKETIYPVWITSPQIPLSCSRNKKASNANNTGTKNVTQIY